MKPFDKSYVFEKIKEYNSKIDKRKIGDYEIKSIDGLKGIVKGYLYEKNDDYNIEILELHGPQNVWMRLTPLEIQASYFAIKMAKGKVGVVGLGLGYVVEEMAKKDEVEEITVYEISQDVIDLYYCNFPKNKKIKILCCDAFKAEGKKFDFFYSDIYEYDLHLDHFRELIYINPTPIDNGYLTVKINDKKVNLNQYAKIPLNADPTQIILINVQYNGESKESTTYRLNVYQGTTPPDDENVTGIISNVGVDIVPNLNNTVTPSYDYLDPTINMQNAVSSPAAQILHINEQGQLVDSQGNVISDSVKESLPAGFGYILGADGIVTIGKLDEVLTTGDTSTQPKIDKEQIKTIVIYFSAFLVISAAIGGFAYYRMTVKRRRTKTVKKTDKKKKDNKKK